MDGKQEEWYVAYTRYEIATTAFIWFACSGDVHASRIANKHR
jgi:hypothetical protein